MTTSIKKSREIGYNVLQAYKQLLPEAIVKETSAFSYVNSTEEEHLLILNLIIEQIKQKNHGGMKS